MKKTARILVITGAVVGAAVAAYHLIPAIKQLASDLKQLQLILEDVENSEDDEPEEMYRVGSIDIKDPEVLRRIDEALKDRPDGWTTHERPVRHPDPVKPVTE